jgi:hypothetical protein
MATYCWKRLPLRYPSGAEPRRRFNRFLSTNSNMAYSRLNNYKLLIVDSSPRVCGIVTVGPQSHYGAAMVQFLGVGRSADTAAWTSRSASQPAWPIGFTAPSERGVHPTLSIHANSSVDSSPITFLLKNTAVLIMFTGHASHTAPLLQLRSTITEARGV